MGRGGSAGGGGGGGHGIPDGERLGTLALVGLIYFTAAGGAYGSESMINSVGPLPVIITHAIFPFCWSLPIGLATTELATAYPSDGGIAVWAALAFNDFWGFMGGYFSLVEGCVNLAVFPTVTLDYLMVLFNVHLDKYTAYLCKALISLLVVYLNMQAQILESPLCSAFTLSRSMRSLFPRT